MPDDTYSGVWPVAPTPFRVDGTVDESGMLRVLDCMIDQGVNGICILANFSEQFLLSDAERDRLTRLSLEHIDDRVPVIVTISHFSTDVVVSRARNAKSMGASIVMMMPPYHGALLRGSARQTLEQFRRVGEVGIPIMLQDAPISGVELSASLLVKMFKEIEMLKLAKVECPGAAEKLRGLLAVAGDLIEGPFDGEEGVNLMADLDAGITGTMTSATIPDLINPIVENYHAGDREQASKGYRRILPMINHENRQCGLRAAKVAMMEGGVIQSDTCRHPLEPLHPATRSMLLELMRPLDPIVLRWDH